LSSDRHNDSILLANNPHLLAIASSQTSAKKARDGEQVAGVLNVKRLLKTVHAITCWFGRCHLVWSPALRATPQADRFLASMKWIREAGTEMAAARANRLKCPKWTTKSSKLDNLDRCLMCAAQGP
jgi:hypothetical protein